MNFNTFHLTFKERRLLKKFKRRKSLHEKTIPKFKNEKQALLQCGLIKTDYELETTIYGELIPTGFYSLTETGKRYELYRLYKKKVFWIPVSISILSVVFTFLMWYDNRQSNQLIQDRITEIEQRQTLIERTLAK